MVERGRTDEVDSMVDSFRSSDSLGLIAVVFGVLVFWAGAATTALGSSGVDCVPTGVTGMMGLAVVVLTAVPTGTVTADGSKTRGDLATALGVSAATLVTTSAGSFLIRTCFARLTSVTMTSSSSASSSVLVSLLYGSIKAYFG